ncbi:hypothetical protein ACIG3E_33500 [Streptomyces sp. NPDC053474]|uniref:hypothetical protein n=1 Tax=Streptomyces sp. NPDC053474 TaxID=3365704 RepID=UPI0037D93DAA
MQQPTTGHVTPRAEREQTGAGRGPRTAPKQTEAEGTALDDIPVAGGSRRGLRHDVREERAMMPLGLAVVVAFALLVTLGPKRRRRRTAAHAREGPAAPAHSRAPDRGAKDREKQPDGPRVVLTVGVIALLAGAACLASLPLKDPF